MVTLERQPKKNGHGVDPTTNVRELVDAAVMRLDDLRAAEQRLDDERHAHAKEMALLREAHSERMAVKESGRLDSIRQVDREDVAKTAATANTAIATLAKQTTDMATTLETRRTADAADANRRISALEVMLAASAGKQQVVDPLMEKLIGTVDRIAQKQIEVSGAKAGINAAWVWVVGAAGLIGTVFGIISAVAP